MFRAFIFSLVITLILLITFNKTSVLSPKIEIIQGDKASVLTNIPIFNERYLPQNHLNYRGSYQGTFPCADCKGTEITLELTQNQFKRTVTRLGVVNDAVKIHTGAFIWDDSGTKIQLELPSKSKYQFKEGHLYQLGIKGAECLSFKGVPFTLNKVKEPLIYSFPKIVDNSST